MPIYAYKCSACGFAKDVLQKMSDAPLTVCPHCGASAFSKQVTAAGFQLKGSGWYVTDFRDGGGKKNDSAKGDKDKPSEGKPAEKSGDGASTASSDSASSSSSSGDKSSSASPAPASSPAPAAAPASTGAKTSSSGSSKND